MNKDPHDGSQNLIIDYLDMTDSLNFINIIQLIKLDEIYN